ncbi:MAG: serine/threonine-protein kinase, partial [Phycisphaerae bacterium]
MDSPNTSGPTADGSDPQTRGVSGEMPTRNESRHVDRDGSRSKPGDRVGPYTLLELIGEGGFGTVWLAERREPMVQRVAIKIIKPGMDSKAVVARFDQERQALAVMDHPNVAKVFDGGVTERGLPYFVMEHVAGEPITNFCDRRRYTIRQRLELFISVCDAVQHAHMKGIIHRDLKPSNVLAEMVDGKPLVKVIDFGIAKALVRDADVTQFTSDGMIIGTPEYMSPEQADGQLDVDTRADVYALGVMLYELLVGRLPFDPTELRRRGHDEIRRIIREQEPPKPSTRLSTIGAEGSTIARSRHHHSAATLIRELRRELEWIPLKAIRKERERRYESAAAFGEDVRRYLDGHAVHAAPESRAYLAKKFVSRNRVTVGATTTVFLTLILGLAGTLWQKREAERQRDLADLARKSERERADELTAVVNFQADMIGKIDFHAAGKDLMTDLRSRFENSQTNEQADAGARADRTREFATSLDRLNSTDVAMSLVDRMILSRAAASIHELFAEQPATQAQLQQSLADLYVSVGLPEKAVHHQESALVTRRRVLGGRDARTIASVTNMAVLFAKLGRFQDSEALYREAVASYSIALGEHSWESAAARGNLAALLSEQGRLAEAETLAREA